MRTAILLPSGCSFSASRPNSMETVVRTLIGGGVAGETLIFCSEGAEDHGLPNVQPLPESPDRWSVLLDHLTRFKPDLIEHHQQVKQATIVARALPGQAHVLYRHNALKPPRNLLDAWRYNRRYGRMDGLIFVSQAERETFSADYPAHKHKAWSVPNPIDATPWLAAPQQRRPIIAFAGRAMAEKGLAELCAALPTVLDRHPEWRAVLMLNDWDHHHFWATPHIAPLAVYGERVVIHKSAPLAIVRAVLKTAAIAVTPSLWAEPFGLSAVEAHAAGAALISSGRGGLREASGPHASYLDAVTPQTLAMALDQLITSPDERLRMAIEGQAYVIARHKPERRAAELSQVRAQILQSRRARLGRTERAVAPHAAFCTQADAPA